MRQRKLLTTMKIPEIEKKCKQNVLNPVFQIEVNCKLEYVALIQFSSLCELVAPFSRDMDMVRESYKKSCFNGYGMGQIQAVVCKLLF